jgi:hypothetical protein
VPNIFFRKWLCYELSKLDKYDRGYIMKRVNYYNQLDSEFCEDVIFIKDKKDLNKKEQTIRPSCCLSALLRKILGNVF